MSSLFADPVPERPAPSPAWAGRLLAGPPPAAGPESLAGHLDRLGRRPSGGAWLLAELHRSGLRGRGGAWYPTSRKWEAVARATRARGEGFVVVNASEGEPLSRKDRTLAASRPHLVLDGAVLAAETLGARQVVVYASNEHREAVRALNRAVRERRARHLGEPRISVLATAHGYVGGESSAVASRVSGGPAKPTFSPPYTSEQGVLGRPTLVQNAETLAHVALIARGGGFWFRQAGTDAAPGTALITVAGAVARAGVYEVEIGSSALQVLYDAGGVQGVPGGALLGGYFGSWLTPGQLARTELDHESRPLGCGLLAVLPESACPLEEAAHILDYLARESAGQCGPCVFGLKAASDAMWRLVDGAALPTDLHRLRGWAGSLRGRGACKHPDGAVGLMASALDTFSEHVGEHLQGRACGRSAAGAFPRPPARRRWPW